MKGNKKSFVLHKDSLTVLDELSDDQAGKLFKAIKSYQLGEDLELDDLTRIMLHPFKSQFERDEERYQEAVDRNKINGSKGGRPKKQQEPTETQNNQLGFSETDSNPTKAKKADSDSDSDSDSEKNINTSQKPKVVCPHNEILNLWDEVMPSHITRHRASLWRNNPGYNNLKQRWEEMKKYERQDGKVGYETQAEGLEFWRHLFNHLTNSDFMMNEWKPSLADILVKSKFYPALEGKYHASRQH